MNYEDLSFRELQKLAAERELSTGGKKDELVARLVEDDYEDVPVRVVLPAEPEPTPSTRYNPGAWHEGDSVKVAYQFNGRLTVEKAEYFHEETRRHAKALGYTVTGVPGILYQQGAVTVFVVRVK